MITSGEARYRDRKPHRQVIPEVCGGCGCGTVARCSRCSGADTHSEVIAGEGSGRGRDGKTKSSETEPRRKLLRGRLSSEEESLKVLQYFESIVCKEERVRDEAGQLSRCPIRMDCVSHFKKFVIHYEAWKPS